MLRKRCFHVFYIIDGVMSVGGDLRSQVLTIMEPAAQRQNGGFLVPAETRLNTIGYYCLRQEEVSSLIRAASRERERRGL